MTSPDLVAEHTADRLRAAGLIGLAKDVAQRHHVDLYLLLGTTRLGYVCRARFAFWGLIRWTLGFSFPAIGRLVGRDHSTVMAGIRKRQAALDAEMGLSPPMKGLARCKLA